jgi:hypothetical protein
VVGAGAATVMGAALSQPIREIHAPLFRAIPGAY